MATTYAKNSPYFKTQTEGFYLGLLNYREIPHEKDDPRVIVSDIYEHRPDLMASDLYGDSGLWWVFAVRNPDLIEDPIYDFVSGLQIYLPKKATLNTALGL